MDEQDKALCRAVKISMVGANVSITELAEQMGDGWTYDKLNNVANGRTKAKPPLIAKLRTLLDLPASWPEDEVRRILGHVPEIEEEPEFEVPLVGPVSAGPPVYNVDPERQKVLLPARLARITDHAHFIDGDSMMPHLQDMDCACFKTRHKFKHGFIYLIETEDKGYLVKVAWYDRGEWYLRSYNPTHRPFKCPDGARVVGVLVGFARKVGTHEMINHDREGLTFDFDERFSV